MAVQTKKEIKTQLSYFRLKVKKSNSVTLFFVSVLAVFICGCVADGTRYDETKEGGATDVVYLNCEIEDEIEIDRFSVKLDEESSKVTLVKRKGGSTSFVGIFSPKTVQFKQEWLSSLVEMRVGYEIDRVNLTVRTDTNIEPANKADLDEIPADNYISTGVCSVTTAGRSFF